MILNNGNKLKNRIRPNLTQHNLTQLNVIYHNNYQKCKFMLNFNYSRSRL